MKVTVRVNEFKRVLEEARCLVKEKIPMEIFTYVKVDVHDGNRATVTGTDLGMQITQSFKVVDGETGSFLLPAKQTHDLIKRLIEKTATIETSPDNSVVITSGMFTVNLPSRPVKDFPQCEPMPESAKAISLKFLRKLIAQVEQAVPVRGGVHVIPAVQIENTSEQLRAVATDGFRIAVADQKIDSGQEFTLLIPKCFLPLIKRRSGPTVRIAQSEMSYFFQTDSVLLSCRNFAATFPQYRKVIDLTFVGTTRVSRSALKIALQSLWPALDEKSPQVMFTFENDRLMLQVVGGNSATGSIVASTNGQSGVAVKLNPQFVLDFLSLTKGEVLIDFKSERRFVVFRDSNCDGFRLFIMPLIDPAVLKAEKAEREAAEAMAKVESVTA